MLCWALLCTSYSNAQSIDYATGNLITNNWQGTTPITGYGGYSGGWQPGYISNQKAIVFGYTQGTASQSIAIDAALNAAGAGVELRGYNYSWYYYNNDSNRGSLTGNISLRSSTGSVLQSNSYNMPQTGIGNWIQQSGTQLFANQYQINQVSTLDVSFTGKDDRFWAGYYGPAIKSVNVNLLYGVDPCATNPAYSPNCAGFKDVLTSTNLVPNPDGYAYGGYTINQSYAINVALAAAGSNATIHGFKWGYVANANGPYCNSWDMGLLGCWDFRSPSVSTNVNITSSTGANLYNVSRTYTNSYNTTDYSYLFPASRPMSTLGNFNFTASTNDQAYIGSIWSRAVYTADPCVNNPLYSPSCPGYGAAVLGNTTTSTTTTTYVAPAVSSVTTTASADPTQSAPTSTNVGGVELSTSGTISAPDGVPQVVKDSQPATASSSSSTTTVTASGGGSKPNMSLVMSAVRAVQEQNRANETKAVANAQSVVASSTAQSQETAATVIANIATANAMSSQSSQQASQQQSISSIGLSLNRPSGQGIGSFSFSAGTSVASVAIQQTAPSSFRFESNSNQNNDTQGLLPQTSTGSRTDPLASMMQQSNMLQESNSEQRNDTVKRNVQPNELAGGVDITSMATQPVGFNAYSIALRDNQFYAPKEIYKNQEVIDNRRALRQLGNDSLHQQLINLQYK